MLFVLDSSVTLAWLLPDELSAACDELADQLEYATASVPRIWHLEVGNALLVAERRARIATRELDRLLVSLRNLPIEMDVESAGAILPRQISIARECGLSSYDASYVELARRHAVPLATLDVRLRKTCKTLSVAVLP
jgi:predicted nucleic acid-binding protein